MRGKLSRTTKSFQIELRLANRSYKFRTTQNFTLLVFISVQPWAFAILTENFEAAFPLPGLLSSGFVILPVL